MQTSGLNKKTHIRGYISMLQCRKWTVINFFLIIVAVAAIVTFLQERVYRATATVIVDLESSDVMPIKDIVKSGKSNYFAYRDDIKTQQEIIKSRRTAYHVIKNLKLKKKEEFGKTEDPIHVLLKKLHVEPVMGTRIIAIHVYDRDPKQASMIANEFANAYVDSSIALNMKRSRQVVEWLKAEAAKQKKRVNDVEFKRQAYKEENSLVPAILSRILMNNVRVQDLAEIPKKPIRPRKGLNLGLAIILGLVGGLGLAFFRANKDVALINPCEIAELLQIPVLGLVPMIKCDGKNIKRKENIDRIVEIDIHSLASEAYRSIRMNLLSLLNYSSSSKAIVITSSLPREGKTLTAVNLATIMANSGERVLLVDADMRRPRIHTIYNSDNKSGLAQYLVGEKHFNDVVKKTDTANLYFVTSGKVTHRSAELISSDNMKSFLENAASDFSKIIFDSPPVAFVSDAAVLSSMCAGVILIAEGGKTTKRILNNFKELLQKKDAKILGVIVNNVTLTNDSRRI